MKTKDFTTKMTSARLAENLEKQFSSRVNLTKYNREQLEDIRNKLRTRIFQQEGVSKFNELLTNETYQKDKAMLELLNTRIKEMLGEQMQKLRDKMAQLSESKNAQSTKKKCPPMSHVKKMCKDGMSVTEICKMHPDCDHKELKQMIADCKGSMDEAIKKDKKELEGNAFGKAVRDAKKDGVQSGEKIKVGSKEYPVKEGFPTVDDAKKASQGTAGMKPGEKKKSSTGGEITKTATGLKHTAGKNYGGSDAPATPDSDKKSSKMKEEMKVGDQKKSSTGGTITKTATGVKHTAGNNYGAMKQPFDRNSKDLEEGKPDANKNGIPDYAEDGKGPNDLKKKGAAPKKGVNPFAKKKVKESQYKHNVRFVNESLQFLLNEDEEGKAQAITAAGDIVNDFTGWMQRVGQYQTKAIIELSDQIRAEFGQAESEAFKQAVGPALSASLETLTQQREAISNAVAALASGSAPEEPMGMEPDMGAPMEPGMDAAGPDEMNPSMGDEFGASDAASGGDIASGREMRESKFARRLAESHSIMSKLAK